MEIAKTVLESGANALAGGLSKAFGSYTEAVPQLFDGANGGPPNAQEQGPANQRPSGAAEVVPSDTITQQPAQGPPFSSTTNSQGTTIATSTHNAALTTNLPSERCVLENAVTDGSTDDFYSCAYTYGKEEENLEKLVFIDKGEWKTSDKPFTVIGKVEFPHALMIDYNLPSWGQTRYFAYCRAGLHFEVQISPAIGYSGLMALVYAPYHLADEFTGGHHIGEYLDAKSLLNLPHSIFDIAAHGVCSLTVPYVSAKNYAQMHDNHKNEMGAMLMINLTRLYAPGGNNSTLGFTCYGGFVDLDLQAPLVPVMQGRKSLRRRKVTIPPPHTQPNTVSVAAGPGAWVSANSRHNWFTDSMAIAGENTAVDFKTSGCVSRINDLVEILNKWTISRVYQWNSKNQIEQQLFSIPLSFTSLTEDGAIGGNFRAIMQAFAYWRGSLEFKIEISCPKNIQGKLLFCWSYQKDTVTIWQARNTVHVIQDLGGPSPILTVPFTSDTWIRRTSDVYGHLFCFVLNPMSFNAASARAVDIVVMARCGSDFQLHVPRATTLQFKSYVGRQLPPNNCYCLPTKNEGVVEPLDPERPFNVFLNFDKVDVPIHGVSHSNVDYFFGRPWLLHTGASHDKPTRYELVFPRRTHGMLLRMCEFWCGEILLTVDCTDAKATFAHSYLDHGTELSERALFDMGAVVIPSGHIKTVNIPYYCETPLRSTDGMNMGYLYVMCTGTIKVYMALKSPNLFFPRPAYMMTEDKIQPQSEDQVLTLTDTCKPRRPKNHLPINEKKYIQNHLDEWSNQGRGWHNLLAEGVEPNPGPQLMFKNRGVYRHYGVAYNGKVYSVKSDNIAQALLSGKVPIQYEQLSEDWVPASPEIRTLAEKYLDAGVMPDVQYSIGNDCETWAKEILFGKATNTQSERFYKAMACSIIIMTMLAWRDQGVTDSIVSFMSRMINLITGGFENLIVRTTVKTLGRLLCYIVLYAHSPNMFTTGILATLLCLDYMHTELDETTKHVVQCLVEGKFTKLCEYLAKQSKVDMDEGVDLDGPTLMENQGVAKEFNDWTLATKNLQWWLEKLKLAFEWIKAKIFPPDLSEDLDDLEEHLDKFAYTMALADEHICLMHTDKTYSCQTSTREKHQKLVEMMIEVVSFLGRLPKNTQLFSRANYLLSRLESVTFEPKTDWQPRVEPLGIWIQGTPGVGKSFLVSQITKKLMQHYGWECYSNATGSKHMDGYVNQEIHIFDDLGQNRDEDDMALICQLISTCPFIVPKADLNSKGTLYNGRLVLATTNRIDFTTAKLTDSDALRRRFPVILEIKPREEVARDGRIDMSTAMRSGMLEAGRCWMRNLNAGRLMACGAKWVPMDVNDLVQEIIDELDSRAKIVNLVNQGKFSELKANVEKKIRKRIQSKLFVDIQQPESLFDCEKIGRTVRYCMTVKDQSKVDKIKFFIKECLAKLKKFFEVNRGWFVAIGALASVISLVWAFYPRQTLPNQQSLYDGAPVRLTRDYAVDAMNHLLKRKQPGLVAEVSNQGRPNFEPFKKRLYNVSWKGQLATAVAISSKELMTYGHDEFDTIHVAGEPIQVRTVFNVTYGECPMDLQILVVPTHHQFKTIMPLVYENEYQGDGFLIWKNRDEFLVQPVNNIRPYHGATTKEGTVSTYCYIYEARTTVGSCGGILLGWVHGNLKVLGIHTAGNGVTAIANRIIPFDNQGLKKVVAVHQQPLYHQPRKTKYTTSPLFFDSEVGPAVLSKNDPRLEVEIDDVTKKSAEKYRVNHFDPPVSCFEASRAKVMSDLRKVVRNCTVLSFEEAIDNPVMPMDWSTSPGLKYKGYTKRQLAIDPEFKKHVMSQVSDPSTFFTTYLKDELRPVEKIKVGKTRCIEACNFDYVIAYRMIMGGIYQQIYKDREAICGLAVGICPYTHFGGMLERLSENCLLLDFSGFDGSLSVQLMEAAVECLAEFHSHPQIVRQLHNTVIYSHHLVANEEWQVEGGMPSGSPCTTVLNSICNNLAAYTVALGAGANPDGLKVVSYGDDIIISSTNKFDLSNVQLMYKQFFGMDATDEMKGNDLRWVTRDQVRFLKRTPTKLPYYPYLVGKLDLKSMMDKIQWTKGHFEQQLYSFCLELAVHGEAVYRTVQAHVRHINPLVQFPSYLEMESALKSVLYDEENDDFECSGPMVEVGSRTHCATRPIHAVCRRHMGRLKTVCCNCEFNNQGRCSAGLPPSVVDVCALGAQYPERVALHLYKQKLVQEEEWDLDEEDHWYDLCMMDVSDEFMPDHYKTPTMVARELARREFVGEPLNKEEAYQLGYFWYLSDIFAIHNADNYKRFCQLVEHYLLEARRELGLE
ncbi:polyprotein [French Guiana picornavirus]|nr:polyprotein [French Guiana picornavirus]